MSEGGTVDTLWRCSSCSACMLVLVEDYDLTANNLTAVPSRPNVTI